MRPRLAHQTPVTLARGPVVVLPIGGVDVLVTEYFGDDLRRAKEDTPPYFADATLRAPLVNLGVK